jgi:hypothetical protein
MMLFLISSLLLLCCEQTTVLKESKASAERLEKHSIYLHNRYYVGLAVMILKAEKSQICHLQATTSGKPGV